jgi:hypothetical protein
VNRLFLISPANCNGERARWVLRRNARSDLAQRLRGTEGAPLGEVFTFLSALYFRGKLAYAQAFARPPASASGVWIITPTAGLLPHDTVIRLSRLRGFSRVPISLKNRLYRYSLLRSVRRLALEIGPDCEVVLLGSIATGKYLDLLTQGFGNRLRVPADFIGLGDMSRGALLLRCVRENRELDYLSVGSLAAELVKRPKRVRQMSARVARGDSLDTANDEPSGFRRESQQD